MMQSNTLRQTVRFQHTILWFCFFLVSFAQSSFAQWQARGFSDGEVDLASATVLYRANSYLFKSLDAGTTWQLLDKTKFTNWTIGQSLIFETGSIHIYFLNENNGFYFGSNRIGTHEVIFRTVDGGQNWTLVHAAVGGPLRQLQFVSPTQGFAVGDFGHLLKTNDGGISWTSIATPVTNNFNSIAVLDKNSLFIATEHEIIKTTNGGSSWDTTPMPEEVFSISFLNANIGVAVTSQQLYRTTNAGQTWTAQAVNIPNGTWFSRVQFFSNGFGYLATRSGLYKSVDGKFWSLQHSIDETEIQNLDFYDNNGFLITQTINFNRDYYSSTGGDPMPENEAEVLEIFQEPTDQCRGTYPVKTKIINRGINALQSVTLHFTVDGTAQTPMLWNGNLMPGDTSDWINVGMYAYTKTGYQYAVTVRTENPNGAVDDYTVNDEASLQQSFNKFSGSYTVGNSGTSDFTKLSTPLNLLQGYGLCEDVIFNVEPGTYTDDFNFDYIGGYAGEHILIRSTTLKPEDVVIQAGAAGFELAASAITLQGITWKNDHGSVFTIHPNSEADSIHLTLLNNIIESDNGYEHVGIKIESFTGTVLVKGNIVRGGSYGLLYYSPNVTPVAKCALILRENNFVQQKRMILNFNASPAALTILSNNFIGTPKDKNDIFYSIWLNKNTGPAIIANNYIEIKSPDEIYALSGVIITESPGVQFVNNTLVADNISPIALMNVTLSEHVSILNNIFANYGAGRIYSIYDPRVTCDYNSVYTHDVVGVVGIDAGSPKARDLSVWQSISGFDAHSITIDPQLNGGDAHIRLQTSNYALNGSGIPVAAVRNDIDGELRDSLKPDIGADEFNTPTTDLGIMSIELEQANCPSSKAIGIEMHNFGKTSISTYQVNWSVNHVNQTSITGTLPVPVGADVKVSLPTYVFNKGDFEITAWVSNVTNDIVSRNDSSTRSIKVKQGLEGTYTIGGINPDFPTIMDATLALDTFGVCGPVTFSVRAGIYTENLGLIEYAGSSAVNKIIFQSEDLDSTSVVITSDDFSPLVFAGAEWVEVRAIGLKTGYSSAIQIGNAHHITVSHCNVIGGPFITGSNSEFNTLQSNNIPEGIKFYGSVYFERGNSILNNTTTSVLLTNQYDFVLKGNKIEEGVQITHSLGNYQIDANTIAGGVTFESCKNKGSSVGVMSNNMVSNWARLHLSDTDNLRILHNTLISLLPSDFGPVLQVNHYQTNSTDYDRLEIKNNIIVSLTDNIVSEYNRTNGIASDNNIYWTRHSTPFKVSDGSFGDFPPYTDYYEVLDKYSKRTSWDAHSAFFLPRFVSNSNFHIDNDARVKGKGVATGVLNDLDGDVRSTTAPDPGADEFHFTPGLNDAGVTLIKRPGECGSNQNVLATIRNFGSATLTTVKIKWFVSGKSLTTYTWTGSLSGNQSSAEINLGPVTLTPSDSFRIKAWTESPNNVADSENLNDTTLLSSIYQKLSGNYTVGKGAAFDFPSPAKAATYLNHVGVCGPVSLLIEPGIYEEHVWIRPIDGASETNRVTFQSTDLDSTSVLIRQDDWTANYPESAGNYGVLLDGAQFVSFKSVGIQGAYLVNGIVLQNGASNLSFSNMWISVPTAKAYYDGNLVMLALGQQKLQNIVIENSFFEKGWNGIVSNNQVLAPPYFSTSNITIRNNRFSGQSGMSIGLSYSQNTLIDRNILQTSTLENYFQSYGIFATGAASGLKISNNLIQGNYGAALGIVVCNSPDGLIYNNVILPAPGFTGIFSSSNKKITFAFNSIQVTNGAGILAQYDSSVSFINNNIVHHGSNAIAHYNYFFNVNHNTIDYNNYSGEGQFYWYPDLLNSFDIYRQKSGMDVHSSFIDPSFVSPNDLHPQNPLIFGSGQSVPGIDKDFDGNVRCVVPTVGAYEFKAQPGDIQVLNFDLQSCSDVFLSLQNSGQSPVAGVTIHWSINGDLQPSVVWSDLIHPGELSAPFKLGTIASSFAGDLVIKVWTELPNGLPDSEQSNDEKSKTISLVPRVQIGTDFTSCLMAGSMLTLQVPQMYAEYLWSTGSTTFSTEISIPGVYSITAKDVNGCYSTDEVAVQTIFVNQPTITQQDGNLISSEADSYQWILDGTALENETAQTLTPLSDGDYQVKIVVNSCEALSEIVYVNITAVVLGLENTKIYPNPTSRYLTIELHSIRAMMKMTLKNTVGQEIALQPVASDSGFVVDLENITPGIYFLEIQYTPKSTEIHKIIVK